MSDVQADASFVPLQQVEPALSVSQPVLGPGAQLGVYRQALGWSVEQVANQLNLAERQIQALEEDNYAALPGIVIARGFIRAYAKLLKVDAAPLVALMTENNPVPIEAIELRRALSASFSESRLPPMGRNGGQPSWLIGALIFGALLVVIGAVVQWAGWITLVPDTLMVKIQRDLGMSSSAAASATAVESNTDAALPSATAAVPAVAANEGMASFAQTSDGNAAASAALSGPDNRLSLKFREDSWVEIRRADNSVLVARLIKAGSDESFDITQPSVLILGNAAGVDAVFHGKSLELKASAKNKIVRLDLK